MTIFDAIKDICFRKSQNLDERLDWDDIDTSAFMLQRWVSMTSPTNASLINIFSNTAGTPISSDKNMMYHLLSAFCQPYKKKTQYLKRNKREQNDRNEELDREATEMNLSHRERSMYDDTLTKINTIKRS